MSAIALPTDARVLAVEDDPVLGAHVKTSLERHGYRVTLTDDGLGGLALAARRSFDVILLDVLLPGVSGLDLLSRLRDRRRTPVIVMSALGDESHRIAGFDSGADDYLPKPFSVEELRVRIEAVLRRVAFERAPPAPGHDGALRFDDTDSDAHHEGRKVGLTATEYRLLRLLHQHAGEVLSKPYLYQQVLRRGYSRHDRSLDMHVSNIRRKLGRVGADGAMLRAVWGQGYVCEREDR